MTVRVLVIVVGAILLIAISPAHAQDGGCSPSYPDTCISPPPPDLDCGDLGLLQKNFDVVGSDPHGFDRDRDGAGCEPYGISGLIFGHGILGLVFWIVVIAGAAILWVRHRNSRRARGKSAS